MKLYHPLAINVLEKITNHRTNGVVEVVTMMKRQNLVKSVRLNKVSTEINARRSIFTKYRIHT